MIPNLRNLKFSLADEAGTAKSCTLGSVQGLRDLGQSHRFRLNEVVDDYFNATAGVELGCTNLMEHKIELKDNVQPIKCKNYRMSPYALLKIDKEWKQMLRLGVIRRNTSEWGSPALMVPKKDGSGRFVVNYQQLNAVSKRPAYPLPNMSDILDKLGHAKFISTLDFRSASYWQIPVEENSRQYTVFSIPGRGSFEFCRMPFGLHDAPGTFQELIDRLINVELEPYVFAYLDDIIVVTDTFETHLEVVRKVLKREKCEFCKPELKYLGYVVNGHGLNIDAGKVKAILDLPRPKNIRGIRRIVGTFSWFRKFIPNFATLADPPIQLTRKNVRFRWTPRPHSVAYRMRWLKRLS